MCKYVCASEPEPGLCSGDISSLQILPVGPAGMTLTIELLGRMPSDVHCHNNGTATGKRWVPEDVRGFWAHTMCAAGGGLAL